ncbi:acyl-CoA dehydrogenase family protein [Actinomadura sp. CNU-125]|uniref:acyl-CoA dehydrogenase family protein n=1 Tax=Actinomadura sp. CNU-125 TaxID=1904961 RepID=UPI0021CD0F94|nr:acyl-CoA dehydrogenase family protein [Actinomadura sp. CNU-125]
MDFNLDETRSELRGLAADVLAREATAERLEAFDGEHGKGGPAFDGGAWKALAQAGLLGAVLPEDVGGAGLGPTGLAVVLREVGARVARPSRRTRRWRSPRSRSPSTARRSSARCWPR